MNGRDLEQKFCTYFRQAIRDERYGLALKEAALASDMALWTESMTNLLVEMCRNMGWVCCAKWNPNEVLPKVQKEYLTLDITAFEDGRKGWQMPVAAMELENNANKSKIAYCLWKLLCVSVEFRCLICYRNEETQGSDLLVYLRDNLVKLLTPDERVSFRGATLVCIGTRADADSFPNGFFHWWRLNFNTCNFEII